MTLLFSIEYRTRWGEQLVLLSLIHISEPTRH